ncbi:MAG TPA: hypothetical protein VMZ51_01635 [Acidimicrobiales bacterium]|nr:hypothetical protein [Acidimicrobiales bacterium]
MWTRDVEELGSLGGGELAVKGKDADGVTLAQLFGNSGQQLEQSRRDVDRLAVRRVTTMSFGGSAIGLDYGDFLPRRPRKVLAWIFLLSFVVLPKPTTAALLEWSTAKAQAMTDVIADSLPAAPGSTTSTTQQ